MPSWVPLAHLSEQNWRYRWTSHLICASSFRSSSRTRLARDSGLPLLNGARLLTPSLSQPAGNLLHPGHSCRFLFQRSLPPVSAQVRLTRPLISQAIPGENPPNRWVSQYVCDWPCLTCSLEIMSPRKETVAALYSKLKTYRFIQVSYVSEWNWGHPDLL